MAVTLLASGSMKPAWIWWPRKVTVDWPNSHLSMLTRRSLRARHSSVRRTSSRCSSGVGAGDEDVVDVAVLVRRVAKYLVHASLEHLRGVAETESHRREFEEAEGRCDGGLRDILRSYSDVVEGVLQVDLGEDRRSAELLREVRHVAHRVLVRDGDGVESSVVAGRSPGSVFLGDEVER